MWYLVSISINNFIKIEQNESTVDFSFNGKEDGVPVYDVTESTPYFVTKLYDDSVDYKFGDFISSFADIQKSNIIILHFNTVLLNWNESPETLLEIIKSELNPKDKVTIAAIDGLITANYSAPENAIFDFLLKKN